MPTTRTQVYLTEEQQGRIDTLAEVEGVTVAETVRSALDAYLDGASPDPRPVLTAAFSADPRAATLSRDDWSRH